MADSPPFPIPDRVSSLMPIRHRHVLAQHQQRSVSATSKLSQLSSTSVESTASDFLAAKIDQLQNESEYIAAIKSGLDEAHTTGTLADTEYTTQLQPYIERLRSTHSTLRVLKRQNNLLEEELTETVEKQKRRRQDPPPDEGLLERAYTETIMARVMRVKGKQPASTFNQRQFKKDVVAYYSAARGRKSWCHVLGMWVDRQLIKAAHIIPRSLDHEELGHLFGDDDAVTTLPHNGLSLFHVVEKLLDQGSIAIVPMPGAMTVPTTWRCVVLNDSLNMDTVYMADHVAGETPKRIRVKDLHNRELEFLSDQRPRRRYLYMRFVISYLWSKRRNIPNLDEKVESRKFWPSEGAYLRRSTLQTLARAISGSVIPEHLVENRTFESSDDPVRDICAGLILAGDLGAGHDPEDREGPDLVDALAQSAKRL